MTHNLPGKTILGIAAHPDDLDFMASGTIARLIDEGWTAHYLVITDGCKGSANRTAEPAQLVRTRQAEQRAAAKILGVTEVTFLGYEDGMLEVTADLKRDIVRVLRTVRPDTVIAMDPAMLYSEKLGMINHPDHRAGGQAALDAIFPLARDHLSFPELLEAGLEPHRVKTVLLTNFDRHTYFVDITDTFERKLEALAAHPSQFPELEQTQAHARDLNLACGAQAGYTYAEGFIRIDIH